MTWVTLVLSKEIQRGRVTVDIPGFDMKEFTEALHDQAEEILQEAASIVCNDDLSDTEKVNQLAELLLSP